MYRIIWSAVLSILVATSLSADESTVHDLGNRLELFVDAALIDRLDGVSLKLHPPEPREIVMRFDQPWEGPQSTYVSLFHDGEKFRMYYRGQGGGKSERITCYADSDDGINWRRPSLGLHEWQGSRANNIIWRGEASDNFAAFLDGRPGVPDDERYKAVGGGLSALASADGVHWRRVAGVKAGDKPPPANVFDSQNVAFWDAAHGEYVCYFRGRRTREDVRMIARTTSPDFRTWSDWQFIGVGNAPAEHLYTSAAIPYFRAPHIYLAFPNRFVESRNVSDGVFMSSRDGLHFDRRFLEAFLRPGRDPRNWTDRNMRTAWGLLTLADDEISLYWDENYKHPTSGLRRGVVRLDGFVSAHAAATPGELVTKPLRFAGRELMLNYATSAAGSIRVEVQDADGNPLPGFALNDCEVLFGDHIERVVRWRGSNDLSPATGKPARVRFVMSDADLYSYRFR